MKLIDKSGNISEYEGPKFRPDWNRIILIFMTVLYLAVYSWLGGWPGFVRMFRLLIIPFCCIWFAKALGNYKGIALSGTRAINKTSPPVMLMIAGWLVYIAIGFLLIYWKVKEII